MSHAHRIGTGLATALVVVMLGACQDAQMPTEVDTEFPAGGELAPADAMLNQHQTQPAGRANLFTDIPITGDLPITEDFLGGTFEGLLTITQLDFIEGQLVASGMLVGTVTDAEGVETEIIQEFTNVAIDLLRGATGPGQGRGACQILELDIPGGLTLDVLGLVVDLAPVNLEVRAERGPGRLLGNLLCALVHLLDFPAAIGAILDLIDRINQLL
jgi:hypothetical protein